MEKENIKTFQRNEFGLITNLDYKFNTDGTIDWKAMLKPEHLYVNPGNKERIEKKYGKKYEEINIIEDKVEDVDLVILLSGIKYLAKIRGVEGVKYNVVAANPEYAAVNCEILFSSNFETENKKISYQENACAHLNNTASFANKYLVEIATNRAFCRCIRSFLGINVVTKEELGGANADESSSKASLASSKQVNLLRDLMQSKNVKWKNIVDKMKEEGNWKDEYKDIEDLPKDIVFNFIERIKKIGEQSK